MTGPARPAEPTPKCLLSQVLVTAPTLRGPPPPSRSLSVVKCRKWSTRSVPLYTGETGQQPLYRPTSTTPSSLHSRGQVESPRRSCRGLHHHTCFVSLRAAVEVLASCVVAVVSSVRDRFLAQALFYNTKVVTESAGVSPGDRGRQAQGFTRPEPIPKHGYLFTRRSYRFLNKITVCADRCSWPSVRRE